jgi:hypothetical protein
MSLQSSGLVVVVSNDSPALSENFSKALLSGLGVESQSVKVEIVHKVSSLPEWMARNATPHLILIDSKNVDFSELKTLLRGIRELDPIGVVFALVDGIVTASLVCDLLDSGATGVLNRNFKGTDVSDMLKEACLTRLNRPRQNLPRTSKPHKVSVKLASLEQAVVAETVNVGLGGLFIRVVPRDAKVGDAVEFELIPSSTVSEKESTSTQDSLLQKMDTLAESDSEKQHPIHGSGRIAWIRNTPQADGPEGIGIQFSELESRSRRWIETFVTIHRVRSFIPKN